MAEATRSSTDRALDKMGLRHDLDFVLHLPLRYEDETRITPVAQALDGDTVQIEGVILDNEMMLRGRQRQLRVQLRDDEGSEIHLRFFNFYPSQRQALSPGRRIRARGEVRAGFWGRELMHPQFRAVQAGEPLPTRLTPLYPSSAGVPQSLLRRRVQSALAHADLSEVLPAQLLPAGLPSLKDSLFHLHHPPPPAPVSHEHPAWHRLKFEELLAQQMSRLQAQSQRRMLRAPRLLAPTLDRPSLCQALPAQWPFALTASQQRCVDEILADLELPQPMHRLLQGDVGAGKTVVAAMAAARCIDAGWQCALMAPTEILAEQHHAKLRQWLQPLGVDVAWLSGSKKGKDRAQTLERVADGRSALLVGTHAVIQEDVRFQRLGLSIIDEQHRFGVAQRLSLRLPQGTEGQHPHLLMMSATPIPRTLAMSLFADLDLSSIDQLPPGRTPISTRVFSEEKRPVVEQEIQKVVDRGQQVYWVCPLIEESETLDLRHATAVWQDLSEALPKLNIALLHGRMSARDKAEVMQRFVQGQVQVLVSTTVIEVGVDVPNASMMVIEHAERFGLSQLHQLRGRVGRGAASSTCVLLFSTPLSDTGKARLRTMAETQDGFLIAERDLAIRGPGELMGTRQSGDALLRFADLTRDGHWVETARQLAGVLLENYPQAAQAHLARWRTIRSDYLRA